MGNYATTADLIARFESTVALAHLTDSVDDGAADTDVLDEVINDAEGEIDSYMGGKYAIPVDVSLSTVLAARMKSMTLNIATWNLTAIRGDIVSDSKTRAHELLIEYLTKMSTGELSMPSATPIPTTTTELPGGSWGTGDAASDRTSQRKFTREKQKNL